MDNKYVDVGKLELPDKPRPGELVFIENQDNEPTIYVVIETIRQYYKANENDTEVLSADVYVHEVKYSPDQKLIADRLKTEETK